MAYALAIAEELSNHRIQKRIPCLLGIFGEDYKPRFTDSFKLLNRMGGGGDIILSMFMKDVRSSAVSDVKNGMFNCSNYLVSHAAGLYRNSGSEIEPWETQGIVVNKIG